MQTITFSHLRTHRNELKEALQRGEEIQLTSRGQIIGIITPYPKTNEAKKQERSAALQAFFQLGAETSLEAELDRIKTGRKGRDSAF